MSRHDLRFDITAVNRTAAAFGKVRGELSALDSGVARVTRTAAGLAGAFGLGIAAGGLAMLPRAIRRVVAETAKIGDVAAKVGLTTTQLQSLRFAAEQTGVSTQTLDMAMQRFSRRIGEAANGTGELFKIVKANNLQLRKTDGTMRPLMAIFRDYTDLIKNAASEQERLVLAFKAYDSEGAAMVNTSRDGAAGIDAFAKRLAELNGIMQDEAVDKADDLNDAFQRISTTLDVTFKKSVIGAIMEIDKISNAIDDFMLNKNLDNFMRMVQLQFGDYGGPKRPPLEITVGPSGSAAPTAKRTIVPGSGGGGRKGAGRGGSKRDPVAGVIAALEFEAAQLSRTSDERRLYNELKRAGIELDSVAGTKISGLVSGIAAERLEIERAKSAAEAFSATLSSGLVEIATRGGKVSDVLSNIANQLTNRALNSLLGSAFSTAFGGAGGSGLFAPLFGGARADGGPVSAGRAYLVGERGPELFMPSQSGAIAAGGSGGGGVVINQSFDFSGADPATVVRLQALLPRVEKAAREGAVADVRRLISSDPGFRRPA